MGDGGQGTGVGDALDARLLSLLQRAFPLEARPFAALGGALGVSEEEVLDRVRDLKARRVIRQISAIFDSRRLGYRSCLVAAQVAPEGIEAAAAAISRHPGVSHNYERAHAFNVWFTLTVPPGSDLEAEVARLRAASGAAAMRLFPNLRTFKIGVVLDMGVGEGESVPASAPAELPPRSLSEREIAAVRALQEDLRVEPRPFLAPAEAAGMDEAELLEHAGRFREGGEMRRFAAVLHHRRAGFSANGMVVWDVPEERVAEVGERLAAFAAVSHCYQRPRYPDWPYSLFTMVHARSTEECERIVAEMAGAAGGWPHAILYSLREFKKVRVRYFE